MESQALPHDERIERALLGSILQEPHRAAEASSLPVTAFYSDKHRVLFRAIAEAFGRHGTADPTLIAYDLTESGKLDNAGGFAYLESVFQGSWRGQNLKHYVNVLLDLHSRREAIIGAEQAAKLARDEGVDAVRSALSNLARRIDENRPLTFHSLDLAAAARGVLPEIPWLVEGWLGAGDATLFGGEWGTGKSLIALDLALSLAAAIPWLGRIATIKSVPVLYLDEENNPVNASRRLARMISGRELGVEQAERMPLIYGTKNRVKLDHPHGCATVERLVVDNEIKVIVLDSFIRFGRLNANKNDELAAFFDQAIAPLIGRYGCAVVMLDHMRKPGADDDKTDIAHRITGGSDKSGFADNVWVIHGRRDESSRTFEARKNRWEDTLPPPLTTTWEVSEDESSARVTAKDASLSAESVVLGALIDAGTGGAYASDLFDHGERKGVPRRTIIRTLKRLVKRENATRTDLPGKRVKYHLKEVPRAS